MLQKKAVVTVNATKSIIFPEVLQHISLMVLLHVDELKQVLFVELLIVGC